MSQRFDIMGTSLLATSYELLREELLAANAGGTSRTVDFTNTHIVTARRHDPLFRATTSVFDTFVPDGMPLIWWMNARGAGLTDRVYGPTFTRFFLERSPGEARHYFLGGSEECLARLTENLRRLNPELTFAGMHHGYFGPDDEPRILADILDANPDFLWIGLGTPKQQEWIAGHRERLPRMSILAVGFAFDVNAGMKADAPPWMQRLGLTWLFRLCSEPRRLWRRYTIFNSLFLYYLVRDVLLPKGRRRIGRIRGEPGGNESS